MQKIISLRLLPSEAANETLVQQYIANAVALKVSAVSGYHILKHSIDARGRQTWINLSVKAFINEPLPPRELIPFSFQDVKNVSGRVIVIGAGPAGLFAALQLIEKGIKPIILERGKDVKARRRDLAILNKEGIVNPESNYCFGEGGAGTYSDGKLYTRSTKRGDINRILNLFVHFGAEEKILYEAHPHIGTNKLPQIITSMRKTIVDCGGEFLFEKKVIDFLLKGKEIKGVKTADGNTFEADAILLATGHSARDIFEILHSKKILIESKPFALGVRVEHPQSLIDSAQYHCKPLHELRSQSSKNPVAPQGRPVNLPQSDWSTRLGGRVLPDMFTVRDIPNRSFSNGKGYLGNYEIDLEGVEPKPLTIIEKGTLKSFLYTRMPVRGNEGSNGRARFPGDFGGKAPFLSNVEVKVSESKPLADLKKQLIEMMKLRSKEFGLIVRKLDYPTAAPGEELQKLVGAARAAGANTLLSLPLLVYKIYPDGREELVRGLRFRGVSGRSLRDVIAASKETTLFSYFATNTALSLLGSGGYVNGVTIESPGLLFDELEFEQPQSDKPRLPVVPPPTFEN